MMMMMMMMRTIHASTTRKENDKSIPSGLSEEVLPIVRVGCNEFVQNAN